MDEGVRLLYRLFLVNDEPFDIVSAGWEKDLFVARVKLWGMNTKPYKIYLTPGEDK